MLPEDAPEAREQLARAWPRSSLHARRTNGWYVAIWAPDARDEATLSPFLTEDEALRYIHEFVIPHGFRYSLRPCIVRLEVDSFVSSV